MKIQPVRKSRKPEYPTINEFANNPGLLNKNVPLSWLKNKYVAASLSAFVLCGMPKDSVQLKADAVIVQDESTKDKPSVKDKRDKKLHVKIAPIFAHGEGHGATGCMSIAPPVFISESEAMELIMDELKKENLLFDTKNCPEINFVSEPIANSCYGHHETDSVKSEVKLIMDGYNKKYNLAFQYVSTNDFLNFTSTFKTKVYSMCGSSVQGFRTKQAAEIINDELKLNSNFNAVVFYDPITYASDWEDDTKDAKNTSRELLLAQVRDFIKWIKNEGILK